MGKPTNGTYAGFNPYLSLPFPWAKNPRYMIVTFTGIIRTPFGVAQGAPPAPNRNFCPERTDCTGWHEESYEWYLDVYPELNRVTLHFTNPIVGNPWAFVFNNDAQPNFAGDNELLDPAVNCYVGGRMALSWMEHYGPDSVWFLMDAFGLDYSDPTMLEQIPQLSKKSTIRFADQKDGTCIHIKLDKNWGVFLPISQWFYNTETHDLKILLTFPRAMDITSTPSKNDFTFCNYYEDEILAASCAWNFSTELELHFTTLDTPTEDSWFDYKKGLYPLSPLVGDDYADWNHMFFVPEHFLS